MAVARCEKCGCPEGLKLSYVRSHKFVSDATSRIYCGATHCVQLALVCWLTDEEEQQYLGGERLFKMASYGTVLVT